MILDEFGNEISPTPKKEEPKKEPETSEEVHSDEDWKAQAQKELEELSKKSEENKEAAQRPPEASFMSFLSSIEMQVAIALGMMALPNQQPSLDLGTAKYLIDTLAILEEKTKGNLTDEEASHLTEALGQFRMAFVQVSQAVAAQAGAAGAPDVPPPPAS